MKFDIGIIAIIVACLAFYLRLLYSQRQKTKAWEQTGKGRVGGRKKGSRKAHGPVSDKPVLGNFSKRKRDWLVGGIGYLLVMVGILLYTGVLKSDAMGPLWWFPVSIGIVGFSWFFN